MDRRKKTKEQIRKNEWETTKKKKTKTKTKEQLKKKKPWNKGLSHPLNPPPKSIPKQNHH
jgi:hypothetical protein